MRHLLPWGQTLLSLQIPLRLRSDQTVSTLPWKLKFKIEEFSVISSTSKLKPALTLLFQCQTKVCSVNFLPTEGSCLSTKGLQAMKRGQVYNMAIAATIAAFHLRMRFCITYMLVAIATLILLFVMFVASSVATNMDSILISWEAISARHSKC